MTRCPQEPWTRVRPGQVKWPGPSSNHALLAGGCACVNPEADSLGWSCRRRRTKPSSCSAYGRRWSRRQRTGASWGGQTIAGWVCSLSESTMSPGRASLVQSKTDTPSCRRPLRGRDSRGCGRSQSRAWERRGSRGRHRCVTWIVSCLCAC